MVQVDRIFKRVLADEGDKVPRVNADVLKRIEELYLEQERAHVSARMLSIFSS